MPVPIDDPKPPLPDEDCLVLLIRENVNDLTCNWPCSLLYYRPDGPPAGSFSNADFIGYLRDQWFPVRQPMVNNLYNLGGLGYYWKWGTTLYSWGDWDNLYGTNVGDSLPGQVNVLMRKSLGVGTAPIGRLWLQGVPKSWVDTAGKWLPASDGPIASLRSFMVTPLHYAGITFTPVVYSLLHATLTPYIEADRGQGPRILSRRGLRSFAKTELHHPPKIPDT
jgi:hypothetical protein